MIQRKLDGLTSLAKLEMPVHSSDRNLHENLSVVISKVRFKGHTKNCDGLPSYSYRSATICSGNAREN